MHKEISLPRSPPRLRGKKKKKKRGSYDGNPLTTLSYVQPGYRQLVNNLPRLLHCRPLNASMHPDRLTGPPLPEFLISPQPPTPPSLNPPNIIRPNQRLIPTLREPTPIIQIILPNGRGLELACQLITTHAPQRTQHRLLLRRILQHPSIRSGTAGRSRESAITCAEERGRRGRGWGG